MSRRGRKVVNKNTNSEPNSSILCFFKPETEDSSISIIKPLLVDIVNSVVDSSELKSESKKHDGERVLEKTFQQWKRSYPWLERQDNRLKCLYCAKFKFKNVWAGEGTPNVQRSSLERHNLSKDHKEASKMYIQATVIPDDCDEACTADLTVSTQDQCLFRTVYSAAKNEMPSEKVNALLELQALNGCDIKYKNLSWTSIAEMQQCISTILKRSIIDDVNESEFFSLMLDESTDITIEKHLSICIRYVKGGESVTKFLANVKVPDGCATTIVNALYKCVTNLGVDMSKSVSLATDGASVMLGRKTGVGVQVQAKYSPFAIQTHCFAHRLNLALTDSIKKNETLQKFRDKFGSLYIFMSGSSNRTTTLKAIQQLLEEPELSVKEPHSIRWLGLKNAVYAVYMCYGSVLATLSKFAQENNATAKGLYKYFSNYKVALLIGFMLDIHTELATLSCQLQKQELLFSEVPPLVDSILGRLDYMKSNDGGGLCEMKRAITVKDDKARYGGEELKNFGKSVDSQLEDLRVQYISNITKNIKQRFRKENTAVLNNMAHVFEPLTVKASTENDTKEAVEALANLYGSTKVVKITEGDLQDEGFTQTECEIAPFLNKEALVKEWPGLCGMLKGSFSKLTVGEICKRLILLHHGMYPNMAVLAKIALCLMVTSVECERSFSYQNRLKCKFRSSLKSEKLANLMAILMCGPPVTLFDPIPPCKLWLAKKRRKGRLLQDFKPRKKACKDC